VRAKKRFLFPRLPAGSHTRFTFPGLHLTLHSSLRMSDSSSSDNFLAKMEKLYPTLEGYLKGNDRAFQFCRVRGLVSRSGLSIAEAYKPSLSEEAELGSEAVITLTGFGVFED